MAISKRKVRGLIFDFDGTVANTTPLILATYHATLEHFGILGTTDQDIIATFGLPLEECMEDFKPGHGAEMCVYYRKYNASIHDAMIRPFPGVAEGLALLKAAGYPMVIVTSKLYAVAQRGLCCLQLEEYFLGMVGGEMCTQHKPEAEPMLLGAQKLGLLPSQCLCIGDSIYDIMSGRNAACPTAFVSWSSTPVAECLAHVKPDYVLDSLLDLPLLLAKVNGEEGNF